MSCLEFNGGLIESWETCFCEPTVGIGLENILGSSIPLMEIDTTYSESLQILVYRPLSCSAAHLLGQCQNLVSSAVAFILIGFLLGPFLCYSESNLPSRTSLSAPNE